MQSASSDNNLSKQTAVLLCMSMHELFNLQMYLLFAKNPHLWYATMQPVHTLLFWNGPEHSKNSVTAKLELWTQPEAFVLMTSEAMWAYCTVYRIRLKSLKGFWIQHQGEMAKLQSCESIFCWSTDRVAVWFRIQWNQICKTKKTRTNLNLLY